MQLENLADSVMALVEEFLESAEEVKPVALGLDRRCASVLYVTEDYIGVSLDSDKSLQYYGGFEYVDESRRVQVGDFVFYTAEDSRVVEHIEKWQESQKGEE